VADVLVVSQDELSLDLKSQVIALLESAWPSERSVARQLREPLHDPARNPLALLLLDAGAVIGYLAIPSTTIRLADHTYRASGLSAVITHPDHRRRGHGHQLVVGAREAIAASGADIGVFTCDPPLVSFYVGCGWTPMPRTAVVGGTRARPFPAAPLGKQTMMGFFSPLAITRRRDFELATLSLNLREGDLW
jgi:aminoglycoside 2'-N-acetyltransferase I